MEVVAKVPWQHVRAVVAGLMLDTEMFPVRYFVSEFPSPEQFQRMERAV